MRGKEKYVSKKAIATFAAMATFVSGIAFAMPALASGDTNFNDKFAAFGAVLRRVRV